MSFRKRNVGISSGDARPGDVVRATANKQPSLLPGVRPSPLDGRPTTSTGTASLDSLLAGHSGLALGASLLIEENGTTDYAGALLRLYAAEGLVQGHHVHVVGMPEPWGRELPGLAGKGDNEARDSMVRDKMKIAWRYEGLGRFGEESKSREPAVGDARDSGSPSLTPAAFCHTFDLAKRLVHPTDAKIGFLHLEHNPSRSPFSEVLKKLSSVLANSTPTSVHRVVIPSLLSPAFYPPWSTRMTVMMSLPLSLYPRSSGLIRWVELLSDGAVELVPFPHTADAEIQNPKNIASTTEEQPQGLLRVHRVPILHERGSGTSSSGDYWAFNMSRRRFHVKPFSLPPIEGDTEAQRAATAEPKSKKADLDF